MANDSGSTVLAAPEKPAVNFRPEALPQRWLGRTGEEVPILGLGTAPAGMGLRDSDAIDLYHRALDLGVFYLDTAPAYGRAQKQLGVVMKERRDEAFLVTKTLASQGEKARDILEESLRDLQTDCVDLTYVHSVGNQDVDEILAPDGALAALREAQKKGWTRFVGFTAHNSPWKSVKLLREAEVDVVMLAMNFADRHTYNFEETALPLAVEQGVGVAAMKVYGGALDMKYEQVKPSAMAAQGSYDHETALRYALGLPGVAVAVVGVYSEAELLQNVAWAKNYTPLAQDELDRQLAIGRDISRGWGPHFGPVE